MIMLRLILSLFVQFLALVLPYCLLITFCIFYVNNAFIIGLLFCLYVIPAMTFYEYVRINVERWMN